MDENLVILELEAQVDDAIAKLYEAQHVEERMFYDGVVTGLKKALNVFYEKIGVPSYQAGSDN